MELQRFCSVFAFSARRAQNPSLGMGVITHCVGVPQCGSAGSEGSPLPSRRTQRSESQSQNRLHEAWIEAGTGGKGAIGVGIGQNRRCHQKYLQ